MISRGDVELTLQEVIDWITDLQDKRQYLAEVADTLIAEQRSAAEQRTFVSCLGALFGNPLSVLGCLVNVFQLSANP